MSCGLIDAAPLLPVRLLALEAHRLQRTNCGAQRAKSHKIKQLGTNMYK